MKFRGKVVYLQLIYAARVWRAVILINVPTTVITMNDISDILRTLLDRYSNTQDLDEEFRRMLQADDDFAADYRTWCREHGYRTATGYRDFINEIVESQDSIWDNYHEFGNDI